MYDIDKEGAEKLMAAVISDAARESIKNYKQGDNNSHNEKFFRDNFMVDYMLPNLTGDDIIRALKQRAKESAQCLEL